MKIHINRLNEVTQWESKFIAIANTNDMNPKTATLREVSQREGEWGENEKGETFGVGRIGI